jgi:hypothetical protein
VRRFAAILLICLFSFSLMAPLLLAQGADASIPECCRRAGKHHCSVAGPSQSGVAVAANCPLYGHAGMATPTGAAIYLKPSLSSFAAIRMFPAAAASSLAHYQLSYSRSSQKRGPPEFLS